MPTIPLSDLLVPICLAISALVADFAQYWFGYLDNLLVKNRMKHNGLEDLEYDENSLTYRLRGMMFYTKQVLMIGAAIWLIAILAAVIFK